MAPAAPPEISESDVPEAEPATVLGWLDAGEIILVDVREIIEYEEEHIPGALLSPLSSFDPARFPRFPGKKVVIHCALGKRSANAARQLIKADYPAEIINMAGGILAWQAQGCPTEVQHEDRDGLPFVDDRTSKHAMPALRPGVHPGRVLESEFLKPFGLSRAALADAVRVPPSRINAIVRGERRITAETAMRLSRYLCTTEEFWLRLQAAHDLDRARTAHGKRVTREVQPRRTSTREGRGAPPAG
ncbi:MAG: HigA family addiction module antitoxin [Magnetovibrio sp.]|nr:HigA family addiction module antitoxin [Magnetovibrio sp.]